MAIQLTTPIGSYTHAFVESWVYKQSDTEDDQLHILVGVYVVVEGETATYAGKARHGWNESSPDWATYKALYDASAGQSRDAARESFEQQMITDGIYPGTLV